jgi:hypothetical protein
MKRMTTMLAVLALSLLAVPALAVASPKFMPQFTTATFDSPNLVVDFKMSGLGSFATVDITVSATATRTDACVNNGQNIPADPKKTSTTAQVSASGTFPVRNGQVTGSLTVTPPPTSLSCPPGQTATLLSISYTDVVISGAGVSFAIGGTFGS